MRIRIMSILVMVGASTFAYADTFQVSLEPSPPATGAELFLHLSSDYWSSCWLGPLPNITSQELDPDALKVFLTSTDFVECLAQPLDEKYSLGVIPPGVTRVELFGCTDNPIPGYPACASEPFFVADVAQGIFRSSFD